MVVKYPGGVVPTAVAKKSSKGKMKIKIAAGNRGMDFENEINQTNEYYRDKDIAVITKRPTPINIVKVDYSRGAKITEAFFETQSTTDYNGVYKSHYLDFEAKSTHNKTSFPLANIAPQQISHLEAVIRHGGIAFFLIHLVNDEEVYLLEAEYICDFYHHGDRKSIPFKTIKEKGHKVPVGYRPRYDYLSVVDEVFLK